MIKKLAKHYIDLSQPLKASLWYVICGILQDIVDILFMPIFTRILTTEQYGIYNVYSSWFQLLRIIFTLNLCGNVLNVGLVKFKNDRNRFVSSTLGFISVLTMVLSIGVFVLRKPLSAIINLPWYLLLCLFGNIITFASYWGWLRTERIDYKYKKVVIFSFAYIILQPVFGIISILYLDIPLLPGYRRVISAVLVQFVIGFILYVAMMKKGKTFFNKEYWKYSFKTGIELLPHNLSLIGLNQTDKIMIDFFSGKADTAVYSVSHSAAFVLQALTTSLEGAYVPWLYEKLKSKDFKQMRQVINILILLIAGAVFGVSIIAPEIMKLLAKNDYIKGIYCIPPLTFSVYLIFVYSLFSNVELFFGKNKFVTTASIIGFITNMGLNVFFISRYGFISAAFTTLGSYIIITITHYIFFIKCINKENIIAYDLYDIKFIVITSGVLFLFMIACEILYHYTFIRWGMFLVLVLTVFLSRNKWLAIIKEIKAYRKK